MQIGKIAEWNKPDQAAASHATDFDPPLPSQLGLTLYRAAIGLGGGGFGGGAAIRVFWFSRATGCGTTKLLVFAF